MFKEDLKFGQYYENICIDYFINNGYTLIENSQNKGKFSDYDFIIKKDNEIKKIEVKSDKLAYKTGNICIEYECYNKKSGINSTNSDYYCYYIIKDNNMYDLYIIPVEIIKKEIKNQNYFKDMTGGNFNKSKFYLFKLKIFEKYLEKNIYYK